VPAPEPTRELDAVAGRASRPELVALVTAGVAAVLLSVAPQLVAVLVTGL
jgi:hypothetical protein